MAFTAPQFNIDCNIWRSTTPVTDPPDLYSVCQLYIDSRHAAPILESDDEVYMPAVWLRLPFGSDVQRGDNVECVAGGNVWYTVRWVERIHLGFSNQYTAAILAQAVSGPPPPPGGGFILMEDGFFILMEDGFLIVLE